MNIFVTGASGFVGRNVVPILLREGHAVKALVRSSQSAELVKTLGAEPIWDDLTSLSVNTQTALCECDAVLHIAAHMDFTYDPKPFYAINVRATERLLDDAKRAGVRKFIYISAAPVVPGSPIVRLTEDQAGKGLPAALYPKTKALGERAVLAANAKGFQTLSLRPPAIWGTQNHHYEELFQRAKQGKWRWVGGGHQILSTIHVKNLASSILAALDSEIGGKAYFVTDGDRRFMRTTFTAIMKAHGIDPGDKQLPRGLAVVLAHVFGGVWKLLRLKSRPPVAPIMIRLMATEFSVSDQKARKELGYQNVISFDEGIRELELEQGRDGL